MHKIPTPTKPNLSPTSKSWLGQKLGALMMHVGVLLSLFGCTVAPSSVRPLQGPGLKPSPLPVAISQIDSSSSKASLSAGSEWSTEASQWSSDSKELLNSAMQKSTP